MNYQCPQCGLSRTGNQAMGLAMPQCICSWQFTPPQTPQPKRKWVDLTDEEINSVRYKRDWTAPWTDTTFARAIEAKLKEKNT